MQKSLRQLILAQCLPPHGLCFMDSSVGETLCSSPRCRFLRPRCKTRGLLSGTIYLCANKVPVCRKRVKSRSCFCLLHPTTDWLLLCPWASYPRPPIRMIPRKRCSLAFSFLFQEHKHLLGVCHPPRTQQGSSGGAFCW